jgi:restriction endonuclease NaeI
LKKNIPESIVGTGHRDHNLLTALADEIRKRAGGQKALERAFPAMLRDCIDDVIMTPKTGRRSYDELEKTEKTYIGTRVEIELRALLGVPKGKLDTFILGQDVDVKNTMGNNWMIPTEAIDHPCILVAADENRAVCFLGLIVARLDYLTTGANKDAKRTVSAAGFANILWLLNEHPYPSNFWRTVPEDAIKNIFSQTSGNRRMIQLFREVQNRPIGRDVFEAVAKQKDFMRRLRDDGESGTRNQLLQEGILLLNGHYDAPKIAELGLPVCSASEFISYKIGNGH